MTIARRITDMIRRLAVVVCLFGLLGPIVPSPAFAQLEGATQNVETVANSAGVASTDLVTLIGRIINVALGFVGIVLLVVIIYAGYLWMTSGGDAEKVTKAKAWIRNAVIGLLIIVSSFAIVNFILAQLTGDGGLFGNGGPGAGGGAGIGFPSAAGSLGGGVIESHIPSRDATNVPRNTAIVITFKEPVRIASFIEGYDDNGTPADLSDDATSSTTISLNDSVVRIFPTGLEDQALTSAQARVRFTDDRRTFVIRPVEYLGSPTQNTAYTVDLAGGRSGVLLEDGSAAFAGAFSSGYEWQFEVSTVIDTTPPRVFSVIPMAGGLYAPNIVVQVNFTEAIDPTSASGRWNGAGFTNMEVSATPIAGAGTPVTRPAGTFTISNQYRTVEFVTDAACGTNSCGRSVFCLPVDSTVTVTTKAATLSTTPPQAAVTGSGYDGIVDMVGNSLDGNGDNVAQGPGSDDYVWSFGTESAPNLAAPRVVNTDPTAGDRVHSSNLSLDHVPSAEFDSIMQASTIHSDSVELKTNEATALRDTFWWTPRSELLTADGRLVSAASDVANRSRVRIDHRLYLPAASSTEIPEYDPFLYSDLQNVYQNCFNPSSSDSCRGAPYCCDGRPSTEACTFPTP